MDLILLGVACFRADILTMTIRLGDGSSCLDAAPITPCDLTARGSISYSNAPLTTSRMQLISFQLVLQFMRMAHGWIEAHFNADTCYSDEIGSVRFAASPNEKGLMLVPLVPSISTPSPGRAGGGLAVAKGV